MPAECVVESLPTPTIYIEGRKVISFCSNNYLGLSNHAEVKAAAVEALWRYGYATSESRRLGGNLELLEELEAEIAAFKNYSATMVTATGLLANIAAVHGMVDCVGLSHRWYGAPASERDVVILFDAHAHRSIRMGARLAGGIRVKFSHNDADHVADLLAEHADKAALVVTEGVFSMDGDLANLPSLVEVCENAGALLLVDDAHGTGVYGPTGSGTVEHFGLAGRVHVQVATLSKALGGMGGAVLADSATIAMLKTFASGYRFTSSLPAELAAGLIAAMHVLKRDHTLRNLLWKNAERLRRGLKGLGVHTRGNGPIVPLLLGSPHDAVYMERELLQRGYWCAAVVPPLVAPDDCRVRLTVSSMHSAEDIDGLLDAIESIISSTRLPGYRYAAERL